MQYPKGRPELGRWWFLLSVQRDHYHRESGWRRFDLALIRLHHFPPDGERIQRQHYRGLWWAFRFWLPWDRA